MKKEKLLKDATSEHIATIVGIWATEKDNWFTKKSYKQAIKYIEDWLEEKLNQNTIDTLERVRKEVKKERVMNFKEGTDIDYVVRVRHKLKDEILENIDTLIEEEKI